MRLALRLTAVALLLAVLFAAVFALWGDWFQRVFNQDECAKWFADVRPVAWLAAIGLLAADLVLPVPASGVMAALGMVYGVAVGSAVAVAGSTLSALIGYGLARLAGVRVMRALGKEDEVARFRSFFDRWGGAAVILSRILPILPEVMSILAGLAPMRFGRFVAAVLLGTIPTALLFASVGAASARAPWYGLLIAVLLPAALWPPFLWIVRDRT